MARLNDARARTAAERLRLVISRSKGGYNKNRAKWAKLLGVSERSVERYLQRRGDSRRRIRDPEMKRKIDRAFTRRAKDPLFLATHVLEPGQYFDVTPWMAPSIGDGQAPILTVWAGGDRDRLPNSVWRTTRPLPRIVFTGGERMGLGFGRMAIDVRDLGGGFVSDGEIRDFSTPNEYASDTFGFIKDPVLGLKARSNDLALGINKTIERVFEASGSSVNIVLAVFDPKTGTDLYGDPMYETLGTTVRNRRPIVDRNADGEYGGVRWEERKRGRK